MKPSSSALAEAQTSTPPADSAPRANTAARAAAKEKPMTRARERRWGVGVGGMAPLSRAPALAALGLAGVIGCGHPAPGRAVARPSSPNAAAAGPPRFPPTAPAAPAAPTAPAAREMMPVR